MGLRPMNIDLTYTFAHCFEVDIRIHRHTNKRGIEQNKIPRSRLSLDLEKKVYVKHDYYLFMFHLHVSWIDSEVVLICCII